MVTSAWAHQHQKDYHGASYLMHLIQTSGSLDTEDEMAVALLHDIVEDTEVTLADLQGHFPKHITTAVEALTKTDFDKDYFSYLERVKAAGKLAVRVKLADIRNNLKESRRHPKAEKSRERYLQAEKILTEWLSTTNDKRS